MDKTGIVQIESGEFSVISHTDNAIRYRVSLGNDENMPYCTCSSWKKSYYPCNHFSAVFLKFPNRSWDTLSPLYVNSPFLQLDIYSKKKEYSAAEDLSHEPSNAENTEKEGNYSDEALPDAKRRKKPWTGRVDLKKDIQEKSSKSENREYRKIAKVQHNKESCGT